MKSVLELLLIEGFVTFPEDSNVINAARAFMGARVIHWIRQHANDPDFNLEAYLVALTYYKLGLADIKFEEDELVYCYTGLQLGGLIDELAETTNSQTVGEFERPPYCYDGGTLRSKTQAPAYADDKEPSEPTE